MSKRHNRLKDYARALISYIALEPVEVEEIASLRGELMRIDALLRRLRAKEKIFFEAQTYPSKMNDQAKLPDKQRAKEYNPYKW